MDLQKLIFMMIFLLPAMLYGQDSKNKIPYADLPPHPEKYTAGGLAARMIDGLGFRLYWATEGLSEDEVNKNQIEDARNIAQTMDHIYGMTMMMLKAITGYAQQPDYEKSFNAKREEILLALQNISQTLVTSSADDFKDYHVMSRDGEKIPFWNFINGPIQDCVWHAGQITTLRRLLGNPVKIKKSYFTGK